TVSLRLIAALVLSVHHPRSAGTRLTVAVDSARREVILSAGPFIIPAQTPSDLSAMDMDQMMRNGETEAGRFTWPVSGLYRSVELEVLDSTGHPLPRRLLHHLNLINFDHGQRIGLYLMWDNEGANALTGVQVRLTFHWAPPNQLPPVIPVMPLIVDAHLVAGGTDGFSVPPGGGVTSVDFSLPISGHLLAATGHLHDQ